jgi:hypothetical protein
MVLLEKCFRRSNEPPTDFKARVFRLHASRHTRIGVELIGVRFARGFNEIAGISLDMRGFAREGSIN